jgi:hypothetical protein
MKIIKKGNKILVQKANGEALDSLDISENIRPNKMERYVEFSETDFRLYFDNLTSIEDENGLVKLKSDFIDFSDFYKYFQENIFLFTTSGGTSIWGGITGNLSAQTDLQNALNLKANAKLQNIKEVYVDYTNGDNTTGLGTFDKPYADLTQSLVLAGANSNIYLNTGIENEKTFTIGQDNVKINGVADNLVFNSDSGFGSTLISNSTINATKSTVFENINFSNTILSITGIKLNGNKEGRCYVGTANNYYIEAVNGKSPLTGENDKFTAAELEVY